MGKESIPARFFKAIFIPEEEYGLETSPLKNRLSTKSILKWLWMCPSIPPMLARSDQANGCMISPCPSWDPQFSKAVNSKLPQQRDPSLEISCYQQPVPATGTPSLIKAVKAIYLSDRIPSLAKAANSNICIHTSSFIHFVTMWETFVDLRDARKSSERLLDSNYAMVMSAVKHPTWLHKVITHAKNTGQNLANRCI